MNNDIIAGIKEDEMENLSSEVLNYADRMAEIFDKMDACMDKLPNCYRGESAASLYNRYKELSDSYKVIKKNTISYSDDLLSVIRKIKEGDKELSCLTEGYNEDIRQRIKTVN